MTIIFLRHRNEESLGGNRSQVSREKNKALMSTSGVDTKFALNRFSLNKSLRLLADTTFCYPLKMEVFGGADGFLPSSANRLSRAAFISGVRRVGILALIGGGTYVVAGSASSCRSPSR